jgi:hypothetical protein
MGYTQIRKEYARIAHYRGFKGENRLVDWHSTIVAELQKTNPEFVINESPVFVINGQKPNSTLITPMLQTHNLEIEGAKRSTTRSHGLESRSRHHLFQKKDLHTYI